MSSYLQQSYLGAWDDARPEGFFAKLGWGLKTSATAVASAVGASADAVKTAVVDTATGTDAATRAEAERQRLAAEAARAKAAKAAQMRNLIIVGVIAAGAYFYFKRK